MSGLLRKAMLFGCMGVMAASSALASVPSPPDSDVPCGLTLVGTSGGVADARGQFSIVIRDLAHNPIAASSVVIDFNSCTPDIRVCSVQPASGVTADCTGSVGSITVVTDATGTATLRIVGGAANNVPNSPGAGFKCAKVYADGVRMPDMNVAAFDQNGGGGVNAADLSLWIPDSFSSTYKGRSDYNCSDSVNAADLSILIAATLGGGSFASCSAYCH